MAFRRKLKRIMLVLFFMTLVIKIYSDYKVINNVNERGLDSINYVLNDSSQIRLISLHNIKDILTESNLPFIQRKMAVVTEDKGPTKIKHSNLTIVTNKDVLNAPNKSILTEESVKGNAFLLDTSSGNDSRIHYDPSFKTKMEEASFHMQKIKTEEEKQKDANGVPLEISKHNDKIQINSKPSNQINKIKESSENLPQIPAVSSNRGRPGRILPQIKNSGAKAKQQKKPQVYKVSHVVNSAEISLNDTEISHIGRKISYINEEQHIYNKDVFGPLKPNDTVIIIQVHHRLANLRYLVESLEKSKYIDTTLVVFSHDFWDEKINEFISSITSFRSMQIFFPYSFQLNPLRFPGRDPRDCVWNHKELLSKTGQKTSEGCLNSKWPDVYGHYREASFTQIKHHWWWKLVHVFEHLRELRNFTGNVMFLEEDHYVLPDFLHMLRLLLKERNASYKTHNIFALGNYQRQTASSANVVERGDWVVNKYNLGFAFDRTTYDVIKRCQKTFCDYDDYNWDWTVAFVSKTCANKLLSMLSVKLSRVLHIGSCGTHMKKENCSLTKEVATAKTRIRSLESKLFPRSLVLQRNYKGSIKPKKPNGGWGDYRDRQLCLAVSNGTNIETVLSKLQFEQIPKGQSAVVRH